MLLRARNASQVVLVCSKNERHLAGKHQAQVKTSPVSCFAVIYYLADRNYSRCYCHHWPGRFDRRRWPGGFYAGDSPVRSANQWVVMLFYAQERYKDVKFETDLDCTGMSIVPGLSFGLWFPKWVKIFSIRYRLCWWSYTPHLGWWSRPWVCNEARWCYGKLSCYYH